MKFIPVALIVLFCLACNDEAEKKNEPKQAPKETTIKVKEKEKTEISVGPGGAEVKTKDADIKIETQERPK